MKTKSISIVLLCLTALVGGCDMVPNGPAFPGVTEPCYDLNHACATPTSSTVDAD